MRGDFAGVKNKVVGVRQRNVAGNVNSFHIIAVINPSYSGVILVAGPWIKSPRQESSIFTIDFGMQRYVKIVNQIGFACRRPRFRRRV